MILQWKHNVVMVMVIMIVMLGNIHAITIHVNVVVAIVSMAV